jgi:hypothetical protein
MSHYAGNSTFCCRLLCDVVWCGVVWCAQVVDMMRAAIASERPAIMEVALDCLQKLIAFKFLQGGVYAINLDARGALAELKEPAGALRTVLFVDVLAYSFVHSLGFCCLFVCLHSLHW